MDATVVPVAIHPPTDSSLLLDGVRVLHRLVRRTHCEVGFTAYYGHVERVKRRAMEIAHLDPQATVQRRSCYRELVLLTEATASCATCTLAHLVGLASTRGRNRLRTQFTTLLPRVAQMIDQTTRRVVHGEAVSAEEKTVSLFEAHTDVRVKDRRDTNYGHRIFLTTGRSGLILDCAIRRAIRAITPGWNRAAPSEHGWGVRLKGQSRGPEEGWRRRLLRQIAWLAVVGMTRSQWVHDKLRRFRAGIEAGISLLKRIFGLARCVRKGQSTFHAYVRSAVFAANLLLLARARLP